MAIQKTSGSDQDFESTIFNLAYNQLQDRIQNILPYMVGAELVKKTKDRTKAIMVFAFRSDNNQIFYVPAFFINGTVKGLDILYSKSEEQFYPLNEDYAKLLITDDVSKMGYKSQHTSEQLRGGPSGVNLRDLASPPTNVKHGEHVDVVGFVEKSDNFIKRAFNDIIKRHPEYLEEVLRYSSMDKVAAALYPKKDDFEETPIKLRLYKKSDDLSSLTDDQKTEVVTNGYMFIDKRAEDEKSQFGYIDYLDTFNNPQKSGLYKYVTKDGTLRDGLVLVRPVQLQSYFHVDNTLVLDLNSSTKGTAYICDTNKVFTTAYEDLKDFDSVHEGMESISNAKPSFSDTYVLVNHDLRSTQPFKVKSNYKDTNGVRRIVVEPYYTHEGFSGCVTSDRPGKIEALPKTTKNIEDKSTKVREITLVVTKKDGNDLSYGDGCAYVPKGYRMLKLIFQEDPKVSSDRKKGRSARDEGKPGSPFDVKATLQRNGVGKTAFYRQGEDFLITVDNRKHRFNNPVAVKIALTQDLGIPQKIASSIIDSLPNRKVMKGYIKVALVGDSAAMPPDQASYLNALGIPEHNGEGRYASDPSFGSQHPPDATQLGYGTHEPEIDGYINQAVRMSQSGQKEIFDTQSIATLAKYVSAQRKIEDYMPQLTTALDRVGRLLFLFNWDVEAFEEMFGRNDLPELNDLFTNVFESLGDLIIFLKNHSPELSINSNESKAT